LMEIDRIKQRGRRKQTRSDGVKERVKSFDLSREKGNRK